MLGDYNLIKLRSKELKIRLLDKNKVAKEKLKWQLINTILPIILILLIGISAGIIKKYKFTRK
jgi:ABC-2 type transport system permease protein